MSTATAGADTDRPRPGGVSNPPSAGATTAPAAERGRTTLADRVVEKIAARAAVEVVHAEGLSRRVVGRAFGAPAVRAHADVDGTVAALRLEMAVEYPASARATTRGVRAHVSERVGTLCDLRVDHIDIDIAVLRRADPERRRVR